MRRDETGSNCNEKNGTNSSSHRYGPVRLFRRCRGSSTSLIFVPLISTVGWIDSTYDVWPYKSDVCAHAFPHEFPSDVPAGSASPSFQRSHSEWVVADPLLPSISSRVLSHPDPNPNISFHPSPAPSSSPKRSSREDLLRRHGRGRQIQNISSSPTCHSSLSRQLQVAVATRLPPRPLLGVRPRECGDHGMILRVSTLWSMWIAF